MPSFWGWERKSSKWAVGTTRNPLSTDGAQAHGADTWYSWDLVVSDLQVNDEMSLSAGETRGKKLGHKKIKDNKQMQTSAVASIESNVGV